MSLFDISHLLDFVDLNDATHRQYAILAASTLTVALLIWRFMKSVEDDWQQQYPRDVVVLHSFDRPMLHLGIPNYSPFCLKLETYLRASGIPYVVETRTGFSKKGKKPYITFNGEEIADTRFCIDWLKKEFGVDLDGQVSHQEHSAIEAYRTMLEDAIAKQSEWFRWRSASQTWIENAFFSNIPKPIRTPIVSFIMSNVNKGHKLLKLHTLTDDQHLQILGNRLSALSSLLGPDDFFMSTDAPTSLDCTAYAFLCNLLLQQLDGIGELVLGVLLRHPNLLRFVRRMGEGYFPEFAVAVDWDEVEEAGRIESLEAGHGDEGGWEEDEYEIGYEDEEGGDGEFEGEEEDEDE
ncbi:hypothetical protein HDU97_002105 [Phlyctochytrium planicorne]|nr:hypothetical protein HDU97_002105 [Phlyctochytrium planicorne]